MWIINVILLITGTVAAVCGISFLIRNKEASGNIKYYIFFYGFFAALWCLCYGLIGLCDDLSVCYNLRKIGILGVDGFLITEVFLISEISGVKKYWVVRFKQGAVLISIIDYAFFALNKVDNFVRLNNWTTWYGNEGASTNRTIHSIYMAVLFLSLFYLGIRWGMNKEYKRQKRFLRIMFIANFALLFSSGPDTIMPIFGLPAVSTSGIGAAVCGIIVWYGATQLNSFDLRMGNIKDRVFNFMDAGVIIFDMDHSIALVNRYAGAMVKDGTDIALNKGLEDFFEMDEIAVDEVFLASDNGIFAKRLWGKSHDKAYSVRMSAVKDSFDEPFCYMCVFVDVTDEVEAVKKFEVASLAKSRFLAQMSHEIRTPINAVLGMNEMILRESKDKDVLDYAESIDSAGNTLLALINSILDFSKIEDGKMDIIPVRYDTASLVNDLVNSISQRADAKGLRLEVSIDETLPKTMVGDDVRFSQVIMNLLTNAVKYTKKGKVMLTMKVNKKDAGNVNIYVSVEDTGMGIKQEDMDKLFISFERLDEKKNHNIEGTGLGISIVKNLLKMMGSRLEVESTYGKGSKFYFNIDQKIADDTPIGDYEKRLKASHKRRVNSDVISAPGARVLVVDDNEMNLKVAKNLLKLCDVVPDLVYSGEEAIEIMRKKTYDMVFLDHMMPGLDGIETMEELKKENLIPDETTMVALTANAVVGARETYFEAGFGDYLSKPIEIKELVEKLKAHLPKYAYKKDEPTSEAEPDLSEEVLEFAPAGEMDEEVPEFSAAGELDNEVLEFAPEGEEEIPPGRGFDMKALRNMGLDTELAKRYCAGDEGLYFDMLLEYVNSHDERQQTLDDFYEKKDFRGYMVTVHALKSNSKSIGAKNLSEEAAALEMAARDGDEEYIKKKHEAVMYDYGKLVENIQSAVK